MIALFMRLSKKFSFDSIPKHMYLYCVLYLILFVGSLIALVSSVDLSKSGGNLNFCFPSLLLIIKLHCGHT